MTAPFRDSRLDQATAITDEIRGHIAKADAGNPSQRMKHLESARRHCDSLRRLLVDARSMVPRTLAEVFADEDGPPSP